MFQVSRLPCTSRPPPVHLQSERPNFRGEHLFRMFFCCQQLQVLKLSSNSAPPSSSICFPKLQFVKLSQTHVPSRPTPVQLPSTSRPPPVHLQSERAPFRGEHLFLRPEAPILETVVNFRLPKLQKLKLSSTFGSRSSKS